MTRRPIFGFGWTGAVAAVALLALLWAWYSGIDIRHHLLQLVLWAGGIDAVYTFVSYGLTPHFLAVRSPIFTLITLCAVLPALHLDPRPGFAWRAAVIAAWGAAGPIIWWAHATGHLGVNPTLAIATRLHIAAVLTTALSAAVLWLVTRSPLVSAVSVAAAAFGWAFETRLGFWPPFYSFTNPMVWNGALFAMVLFVALRRRGRIIDPGACTACGYDLRGLSTRACPECGHDPAAPAAEPPPI